MRTWLVTGTGKDCEGCGGIEGNMYRSNKVVKTRPLEADYATRHRISATDLIRRGNETGGAARRARGYI